MQPKKLAQKYRTCNIRLERQETQTFVWVIFDNIAVVKLDYSEYHDFVSKYNSYKSTENMPEDLNLDNFEKDMSMEGKFIGWYAWPKTPCAMPPLIKDQPDQQNFITDFLLDGENNKKRILKVDNGPFSGESGYTLIDNKWVDLLKYADGQLYSDGPKCFIMVFSMDGELNAVVSPIDTEVSERIKELRQGVKL